jgi:hypothetical protein
MPFLSSGYNHALLVLIPPGLISETTGE